MSVSMSETEVLSKSNVDKLTSSYYGYPGSFNNNNNKIVYADKRTDVLSTSSWVSSSTKRTRQRALVPSATDKALLAFDNTIRKTGVYQQILQTTRNQQDRERTPYRHQSLDKRMEMSSAASSPHSAVSSNLSNITLSLYSQGLYEMEREEETTGNEETEDDGAVSDDAASKKQRSVLEELVLGGKQVVAPTSSRYSSDYSQRPTLSDKSSRRRSQKSKKTREGRNVSPILEDPNDHHRQQQRDQQQKNRLIAWQSSDRSKRLIRSYQGQNKALSESRISTHGQRPELSRSKLPNNTIKRYNSHNGRLNTVGTTEHVTSSYGDVASQNMIARKAHQLSSTDLHAERKRLETQHQKQLQVANTKRLPIIKNGGASTSRQSVNTAIMSRIVPAPQQSDGIPNQSTSRQKLPAMSVLRTLPLQSELEQFEKALQHNNGINQSFTDYVKPSVSGIYHTFRPGGPITRPRKS